MDIPKSVQRNAIRSIRLMNKGYKGMMDTGKRRARQLARGGRLSKNDIKVMRAWFARHIKTSYPGWKKYKASGFDESKFNKNELRGAVAWDGWGGLEMYNILVKN